MNRRLWIVSSAILVWAIAASAQAGIGEKDPIQASNIQLTNLSGKFVLTCWQQGVEIFSKNGVGRISLNKSLLTKSVSILPDGKDNNSTTVFSTETATCKLETSQK